MATDAAQFWTWFSEQHERFRSINASLNGESLLSELQLHLHQYDPDLWFQISEPLSEGYNELIITADGVKSKFALVDSLVATAPEIPKWHIIALKPPYGFDFVHEFGEVSLNSSELWFLPLRSKSNPSLVGLRIGVPDLSPHLREETENSLWLVLEGGIGERACAERIHHIEVVMLPATPEDEGYIKLPELGDYLDWLSRNSQSSV
ncbi:hypothetical protein KOR34_42370 [Posidoniimonas corsicana]|uniref:Uncharacterized protein n=1 Tax=Posidoniimonas corsicana TaxID=1938618 RepID=A0A5C5V1J4_9BACT|nr:hypothetical protein [Posidoniimonas corsicana]TWT32474.1 hypothetical protein KOR34_42370 [Posidoniimonas corsicana]